jgi:hypothetical protein
MTKVKGTHVNIPEDLKKRFKAVCLQKDTNMTDVIVELVRGWVEANEEPKIANVKAEPPKTIAELVQQNFYQLLTDDKIQVDNLKAIASGSKPSAGDLSKIAHTLDIPEEQLVSMSDRDFPAQKQKER